MLACVALVVPPGGWYGAGAPPMMLPGPVVPGAGAFPSLARGRRIRGGAIAYGCVRPVLARVASVMPPGGWYGAGRLPAVAGGIARRCAAYRQCAAARWRWVATSGDARLRVAVPGRSACLWHRRMMPHLVGPIAYRRARPVCAPGAPVGEAAGRAASGAGGAAQQLLGGIARRAAYRRIVAVVSAAAREVA